PSQISAPISHSSTSRKDNKGARKNKKSFMGNVGGTFFTVQETPVQQFVASRFYEFASVLLILLNSAFIGIQTQHMAARALEDVAIGDVLQTEVPPSIVIFGVFFNIIFTVDLGLRWYSGGLYDFWRGEDFSWNCLDLFVVTAGIMDICFLIVTTSMGESDPPGSDFISKFSVNRVLRVIRIVKVARVIRVLKFFRELRMMIFSIMNSMKSLVWVMLVLGLLFYVFGISFTAATTEYLETTAMWEDPANKSLIRYFGTLDRSFLALYMAMAGGSDWGIIYDALGPCSFAYQLLFLVFITFALFAVVNIVTGVFVDSALTASSGDKAMVVMEEMELKKAKLDDMREIFEELDDDGSGKFTMEEFELRLSDERVGAYFSASKLDVSDAKVLFGLLDHDQSNEVSIDEFVSGCYKLQGEARSLDAKVMQFEVKFLKDAVLQLVDLMRHGECGSPARSSRDSYKPASCQRNAGFCFPTSCKQAGLAMIDCRTSSLTSEQLEHS
ncbi:unnamed protein product, partial [Polarella glacialis]